MGCTQLEEDLDAEERRRLRHIAVQAAHDEVHHRVETEVGLNAGLQVRHELHVALSRARVDLLLPLADAGLLPHEAACPL